MKRTAGMVIIVCLLVTNVAMHTFVSGWGGLNSRTGRYGVVHNPIDNLSYHAWAQQAQEGAWLFKDLYTTTEHRALLLNPFFLLAGRLARVFQVHPILILNLLALAAIPLFVISIRRICGRFGFGLAATVCVLALSIGGGGVSWLRYVALRTPLGDALRIGGTGPDLFYFDLYPATAFTIYPYHAVSLALLAWLVSLIVRSEYGPAPVSWKNRVLLTMAALALASTRPYEPVLLIASCVAVLLLSRFAGVPADVRRKRTVIVFCLALGALPMLGYDLWVASQPVWSGFAEGSLNLYGSTDWAAGFFLLWILASLGIYKSVRSLASPAAFLLIWAALCGLLLIALNSGLTKLCGGCTIPLALAAGMGIQRLTSLLRTRRAAGLAAAGIVLGAVASPVIAHYHFVRNPVRVDADLLHAVHAIRSHSNIREPAVLTDTRTGCLLPGLSGFRVFCGHWSLTDAFSGKAELLAALGFRPGGDAPQTAPEQESERSRLAAVLREDVGSGVFSCLMVRRDHALFRMLRDAADAPPLYAGSYYRVFAMTPEVSEVLKKRLRAME